MSPTNCKLVIKHSQNCVLFIASIKTSVVTTQLSDNRKKVKKCKEQIIVDGIEQKFSLEVFSFLTRKIKINALLFLNEHNSWFFNNT